MAKNFMLIGMASVYALISASAYAEGKNYAQVSSGTSCASAAKVDFPREKPKSGNVYSVELGRKVTDHVRVGLELSHRDGYSVRRSLDQYYSSVFLGTDHELYKYKSSAAMVNAYYDIADIKGFVPYVLVGAGVSVNSAKEVINSKTTYSPFSEYFARGGKKTNFAHKIGTGFSYFPNGKVGIDIRYQFVNLGGLRMKSVDDSLNVASAARGKLRAHEVLLGLSYKF